MDFKEDLIKAGEIARKAREYAKEICKENVKFIEVTDKIEKKIVDFGGKPAFPVDISVNHLAAHDSPMVNDERVFVKGDVVKLDLGVHVNGHVTDTAITVEVGTNNYKKLIEASSKALDEACKIIEPGIELRKIGRVVQDTITSYGYSPIRNLSGHGLGIYEVHTGLTIPNFDNNDKTKLVKDFVCAIEPFATTGVGSVDEGKLSGIYAVINPKNVRDMFARKVLQFAIENYKKLPFSIRWIHKEFSNRGLMALRILEKEGVLHQYRILPETSKGIVSQKEHTVKVGFGVLT